MPCSQEGSHSSEPWPSSMRDCGPDRSRSDRIRGDAASCCIRDDGLEPRIQSRQEIRNDRLTTKPPYEVPAAKPVECQRRAGCVRPTTRVRASRRVAAPAKAIHTSRPPWSPPRCAAREPKAHTCATSSTGCGRAWARRGRPSPSRTRSWSLPSTCCSAPSPSPTSAPTTSTASTSTAKHRTAKRLVRRLDALGYAVMLRPKPAN